MGSVAAQVAQVVGAEVEHRVGQEVVDPLVGEFGPLDLEEHELGGHGGGAFLDGHHCGTAFGVIGLLREPQHDVVADPAQHLLELGGTCHQRGEVGRGQLADSAAGPGQVVDDCVRLLEELVGARVPEQVVEVPTHIGGGQVRVGLLGCIAAAHSWAAGYSRWGGAPGQSFSPRSSWTCRT